MDDQSADDPTRERHSPPAPQLPGVPAARRDELSRTRPAPLRTPSTRLTAALAGVMLVIGVGVGAAIGPAPNASFAGASRLPLLLPALIARAAGTQPKATAASAQAAPAGEASAPATRRRRRRRHRAASAAAAESTAAQTPATEGEGSSGTGRGKVGEPAARPLPPITKAWVIELAGAGLQEALASPASAPFIDSHAIPSGALLTRWSALAATTFAGDAASIATSEAQLAETILQPTCPEGTAGADCAPGTPAGLKTADEFLAQTLPKLTSTAAYKSNGLIVVTFASIAAGAASELPGGSTTATLSSRPPAGALLISPFVTAGARPAISFNPASPRQSLDSLLHP